MNRAEQMISYSLRFIGVPYIWGGNHPALGYDCSGFVQEILASVGLDPRGDQSAQTLYTELKQGNWKEGLQPGSLLFFGNGPYQITHVALALSNDQMIEAGGGGHKCIVKEDSIRENAFIRIRPIRKDLVSAIYPINDLKGIYGN